MAAKCQLTAAISGSFKFKPEVDALIDAFADIGVQVLEPTRGWLALPSGLVTPPEFRPLPAERGMNAIEVERRFLRAVERADFLYVANLFEYIGEMAAYEIGYADRSCKPIYTHKPSDFSMLAEGDLERMAYLQQRLVHASPTEARDRCLQDREELLLARRMPVAAYGPGLFLPAHVALEITQQAA